MTEQGNPPAPIVQALLLFYLFERCLAGYMAWSAEPEQSSFDSHFQQYLITRMKKERDDRLLLEEEKEEFDKGFMPTHLADYLSRHIRDKGDDKKPLHGVNAMALRMTLLRLTRQRNSVMHGMNLPLTLEETADAISSAFEALRETLNPALADIGLKKGGAHSKWARILFLSSAELLWIARGGKLPRRDGVPPIAPLTLGGGKVTVAVGHTDHRPAMMDARIVAAEASFWIADAALETAWLRDRANTILHSVNHGRARPLQIGYALEGPVDRESDPFAIPFWRPARAEHAYLCLFAAG